MKIYCKETYFHHYLEGKEYEALSFDNHYLIRGEYGNLCWYKRKMSGTIFIAFPAILKHFRTKKELLNIKLKKIKNV